MNKVRREQYFRGYSITAACFIIQSVGIGTLVTYGVFLNPLAESFGWSRAMISGAASVSAILTGLFAIVVGRMNDRIGPRTLMTVNGFIFGLSYLLMSRLSEVWHLYLIYGILLSIGLSAIDVVPLTTVARWFVKKRGLMTGIVKVGTGTGQLIIPFTASIFIAAYGWRNAYAIIGTAVLILLIFVAQFLRRDPGQMGLTPDWGKAGATDDTESQDSGLSLREAMRTRQFWTLCAMNLFIIFCVMIIIVHIVPYGRDLGISGAKAAATLSIIGGVSMASRFITGLVIDRIGSKKVMMLCLVMLIVGLVWLLHSKELWRLYMFAVIYGSAHGGLYTAISPIIAEFFGMRSHGVLFGIVFFSGNVGSAIGPVLAGYIFDTTATYDWAFRTCVVMSILGFLLLLSLKPIRENRIKGQQLKMRQSESPQ